MQSLENLAYKNKILIDRHYNINNNNSNLFLEKTFHKDNGKDHYFLKLMTPGINGNLECAGYIYFYIDFKSLESDFIGVYVKPEYRNQGLAELLVANWIKLCLDNGLYNLQTNKTQRKPALIYLLKKYNFEISNPELYRTSKYTIDVCEGKYDRLKYLYFKNNAQKKEFINSSIMSEGNYYVLDEFTNNYIVLENLLMSTPYYIEEENDAYKRSLKCIKNHKN